MGLAFGVAVPAVQAGERKAEKSRIRKVLSSKWFKAGVGEFRNQNFQRQKEYL